MATKKKTVEKVEPKQPEAVPPIDETKPDEVKAVTENKPEVTENPPDEKQAADIKADDHQDVSDIPKTEAKTEEFGLTSETFFGLDSNQEPFTKDDLENAQINQISDPIEVSGIVGNEDQDDDQEVIVKQGARKIRIRVLCDNGSPFTGSYGTLKFDPEGFAEVSKSDQSSLEKLRNQFQTLDIKVI